MDAPPLAEAKLLPPRQRAELVDRPRVLRALEAGHGAALTLVAAPAGYGKTTAVRSWCASRDAAFAWVTLDRGDNDPVRLWRYVATAVDRVREGLGRRTLQRLAVAGVAIEDVIDELMNAIPSLGKELVLVLDDLHAVTSDECLASLAYALEHVAPTARIVVMTRTDPSLELGRLRAGGALAELRADDLAFTTAEARQLLVVHERVELSDDELDELSRRTEGWPAALYLAALWLRRVDDPTRAVRGFGGRNRFVAEYLSHEVLSGLDEIARTFIEQLAVLRRFTPALCDAVLDRDDSAARLAELERSNLLVRRLEHGDWYSIHPLFAEYGALQLKARAPEAPSQLHLATATWFRSHQMPVEAIEHAEAAGSHELVAEILLEYHLTLLRSGNAATLVRWAQTLSDEALVFYPELVAAAATGATMIGQGTREQRRFLRLASRSRTEHPERFTPYAEAVVRMVHAASVDGDVGQAVRDGAQAVALARADADAVVVAALAAHARALYLAGSLDDSWIAATQAVEHPEAEYRAPALALALSTLALVALDRKQIVSARRHADAAKAIVGRIGFTRSWVGAHAAASLALVLTEEGRLAEAERELAAAERFFSNETATAHHVWVALHLAAVRCRRGRLEEASATLRAADEELVGLSDPGNLETHAAAVRRELDVAKLRAGHGDVLEAPSEAELAVLRLLSSDLTAREIAARLFLSPNTVRSHTRALYRKLGVNSRPDAVARADALGLLQPNEIT